jgi:hypothetical protein
MPGLVPPTKFTDYGTSLGHCWSNGQRWALGSPEFAELLKNAP